MKLCVNYLTEVRELLEEGKIDYIDYLKLFSISEDLSPYDYCASKKNVMFHGFIGNFSNIADKNFLYGRDIELQRKYFERGNTPYMSAHINISSNETISEEEARKNITENIEDIRKEFNMRIILENVPASKKYINKSFFSNPEFIKNVVYENDTNFLFDIGHARVAAETLNIPFNEYVDRLPMDRVVEIHLAGCMLKKDGTLSANHSKMNEEDYKFIEDAIKKYKTLKVVTLEYGSFKTVDLVKDAPIVSYDRVNEIAKIEVLEQLERLKEIIK